MVEHEKNVGPQLRVLLDERDQLRIRISMAQDEAGFCADVMHMQLRVRELDRAILKQWQTPSA